MNLPNVSLYQGTHFLKCGESILKTTAQMLELAKVLKKENPASHELTEDDMKLIGDELTNDKLTQK